MTEQQLDAIKRLAERFNSSLEYTGIMHDPFDLPKGWVSVNICRPKEGVPPHKCETIIIAGISPAGDIHT